MAHTRLETAPPFDGRGLFGYLSEHSIPGVEFGDDTHYQRLLRIPDAGIADFEVSLDGPHTVVATFNGGPLPEDLVPTVRRFLDLDANSTAIDAHLATDEVLTRSVEANPGIRLPGSLDREEQLLRTMVGQQISIAAARTVLGRLAAELDGEGLFPTAPQIAHRGLEVLRGPTRRVAAIHGVALALASGQLRLDEDLTVEELTKKLVAMPGIGPWTAGYVAMRTLGAADILLSTDLVLLKGASRLGLPATAQGIAEHAQRWAPFRSYAGLHVWRVAQIPWPLSG